MIADACRVVCRVCVGGMGMYGGGGGGGSFTPLQQQVRVWCAVYCGASDVCLSARVQVLNTIRAQSHLDAGAAQEFVVRSLSSMASEAEIRCVRHCAYVCGRVLMILCVCVCVCRRALEQLLNECVIYTVKDAQHYKAIDE